MMEKKRNGSFHFMANTIQAVIWDLDGVIIDSADAHRRAWQRLAKDEGITLTDADFWATFGKRNDDIIPLIWGSLPPQQIQTLADRKEAYFREYVRDTIAPLPGSMELMRALHEAGFAQALATSTPKENIELISELLLELLSVGAGFRRIGAERQASARHLSQSSRGITQKPRRLCRDRGRGSRSAGGSCRRNALHRRSGQPQPLRATSGRTDGKRPDRGECRTNTRPGLTTERANGTIQAHMEV